MRLNGLVFATSLFRKNNIPTSQVCSTRALRDDRTYSYYTTTYHKNLNLPSPALHTVQCIHGKTSRAPIYVFKEVY